MTAVEDIGDGTVSVHFPKSCLKTALPSAGSLDYSSLLALVEAMGDDMVALEASGEISGI